MRFDKMRFLAKISWDGGPGRIEVPCRLRLPGSVRDLPQMVLLPDSETFMKAFRAPSCTIEADLEQGSNWTSIRATEARLAGGAHRSWGPGVPEENYRIVEPARLELSRPVTGDQPPRLVFFLTDSLLLNPNHFRTLHEDGSMSVERSDCEIFQLDGGRAIEFDSLYRLKEDAEGCIVQWAELIARGDPAASVTRDEAHELLLQMDDLLLLVSLAEGRRIACMGLEWASQDQRTRLYRLGRVLPVEKGGHSANDCLIEPHERFRPFLASAFRNLRGSPQYDLIKSALESMTTFDDDTSIGTSYQRIFSALETLVLAYRKNSGLEYVFSDLKEWRQLAKDLRGFLKEHPVASGQSRKPQRAMLYDNIVALQRVSLRCATQALLDEHGIRIDDQWPLFDRKEGVSLTDIRNSITHGDCYSESQWGKILEAEESLRIVTLRVLLASLGWDHQRSRVLWTDWKKQRWREARDVLSE